MSKQETLPRLSSADTEHLTWLAAYTHDLRSPLTILNGYLPLLRDSRTRKTQSFDPDRILILIGLLNISIDPNTGRIIPDANNILAPFVNGKIETLEFYRNLASRNALQPQSEIKDPDILKAYVYDGIMTKLYSNALVPQDALKFLSELMNPKTPEQIRNFYETMTGQIAHESEKWLEHLIEIEARNSNTENYSSSLSSQIKRQLLRAQRRIKLTQFLFKDPDTRLRLAQDGNQVALATLTRDILLEDAREKNPKVQSTVSIDKNILVHPLIELILTNLLTNAFKYAKHRVFIGAHQGRNFLEIVVIDDGDGISAVNLKHVFDIGYQAPGALKGSGVGLTIAHQTINDFHGKIGAVSILNRGSAFYILLPKTSESSSTNNVDLPSRLIKIEKQLITYLEFQK